MDVSSQRRRLPYFHGAWVASRFNCGRPVSRRWRHRGLEPVPVWMFINGMQILLHGIWISRNKLLAEHWMNAWAIEPLQFSSGVLVVPLYWQMCRNVEKRLALQC